MEIIFRKPEKIEESTEQEGMQIEEKMQKFDLKEIKKSIKERASTNKNISRQALNRRYQKLQQLIEEGEYFSEEAIRHRNPLLYQLYIGRYITNCGQNELTGSLTNFLTNQSLRTQYKEKIENYLERYPYMKEHLENLEESLDGVELEDAEDELIVLMHHSFLDGMDKLYVDYEQIDNDESLDDEKTLEDDKEEIYFMDKNDYSNGSYIKKDSEYTGILDY